MAKKRGFWWAVGQVLQPSTWRTRPEELAGLLIVAVLGSTVLLDFVLANPTGIPWWHTLAVVTSLGVFFGGVIVFAMFLGTAVRVMGTVYHENHRGALALAASIGLCLIILTLSAQGPESAFRQTTATVLAAAFIALVIRPSSQTPTDDSEE